MSARRALLLLLLLALAALAPASAQAKYRIALQPPDQEPADRLDRPALRVTFEDARPAEEGGDEPDLVGKVRSNVGIPFGLWLDGAGVDRVFAGMIHDTLLSVGHPVDRDRSLPRLQVVLLRSWIDGYQGYQVAVDVELRLLRPEGDAPLWTARLDATDGGAIIFSPRELQKPYARALASIAEQAADALDGPEFAEALASVGPGRRSTGAAVGSRSGSKDGNQVPEPPSGRAEARDEFVFEERDRRAASATVHRPSVDRPWERVTLVVGATLGASECDRYVGFDGWRGQECNGRLLGGMSLVARTPERFMIRTDFGLGLALRSDIRLTHDNFGGSDHADQLPQFRLRASFAGGAALPIPDGELRLSVGARYRVNMDDPGWLQHYLDEHAIEFTAVGSMWLGPEFRVALDVEPPGSPVRLGPRFTLTIKGRLTWLWSDAAVFEDYEFMDIWSPRTRVSVAPGFALSLPGGDDGGFYTEIFPVITQAAYAPDQEAELMAMLGEVPDLEPGVRLMVVFGGQIRGPGQ